MLPAIAVVPFVNRDAMPEHHLAGDVLAEELIRDLSRSPDLRVISRLSTAAFRHRGLQPDAISAHLNAEYVLSGTYVVRGNEIMLSADLVEAATARMMWSTQLLASLASLVEGERETLLQLVKEIRSAVMVREVERTRGQAVPTLKSYSLLMAAITLMHRGSQDDFEEATSCCRQSSTAADGKLYRRLGWRNGTSCECSKAGRRIRNRTPGRPRTAPSGHLMLIPNAL